MYNNNPCKYKATGICNNKDVLFYGLPTETGNQICAGCAAYEPKYKVEDCIWHHKEEETLFRNPHTCGRFMPDSLVDCDGVCEHFCSQQSKCEPCSPTVAIEGVGRDAEVITNEKGGKQSKTPMALHLVDPDFFLKIHEFKDVDIKLAVKAICDFMKNGDKDALIVAMVELEVFIDEPILIRVAKVLQEGADKYEPNNWRLIPQEQHLNHALIHLLAASMHDTQDNHIDHALCRLMMAHATEPSENFSYTKYKKKDD